jgi:hypothetical protein
LSLVEIVSARFRRLVETENRVDGAAVDADLGDHGLDQLLALCGGAGGDDVANPAA